MDHRPTPTEGWVACTSQASTGIQGKEVWSTGDGGKTWQLRARTKFPGLPGAAGLRNRGNLPVFGYVTGIDFLPDRHGWLWENRGWLLTTSDGGRSWRRSPITKADTVAAQSASLVFDRLGYVLLRGCTVRLVSHQRRRRQLADDRALAVTDPLLNTPPFKPGLSLPVRRS